MNLVQYNLLSSVLKMSALFVFGLIILFAVSPAFAQDAIPVGDSVVRTFVATVRAWAPGLAIVALIIAAIFALFGTLSIARFIQIFLACVLIGGAEILVRSAIQLGQGG